METTGAVRGGVAGSKNTMTPTLSILTPSIPERIHQLSALMLRIQRQIDRTGAKVEHLVLIDNRARSIGSKRDALLRAARGHYVAFVDDDDNVSDNYVQEITDAARENRDVITFEQRAIYNGAESTVRFRLGQDNGPFVPGGVTLRNAWHVCAWWRRMAILASFPDSNYGEDWAWASQLCALAKTETHIPQVLHHYTHDAATTAAPEPCRQNL